jgi:mannose-6-phosphate isomerase-like protein (cupin superfamily)
VADVGRCFVVAPGEGRLIDLGDFEMRVKADAGGTRGLVSVLEATEPPGFGPPGHVHDDAAEAFYVLDGEYVMSLEGDEYRCPAGSFVFIPAGASWLPSRRSAEPQAQLPFPGSDDGLLDDLAAALARSDVTDAELAEIAEAHRMRIVGPPSERYV